MEIRIQTACSFLSILIAKKSRMKIATAKGGDYDKLAENWSKWKHHFENIAILEDLETKSNL